jgi:predicted DNA-binding antitoxin AbrB/MazE fold protein
MKTVRAVYENGVFRPTEPLELPEHSLVEFEPRSLEPSETGELSGLREEDWPDTPEGIARHLSLMDRIEPLDFTSEEEADWEAARKARKDLEKTRFAEQAEALRLG